MTQSTNATPVLGIIGGSGLYDLPGLVDTRWVEVDTPWGAPSDAIFRGRLETSAGSAELAFLPRHGRGHRIPPSEVNYRANVAALKSLGVTDILSLSAVGGLRADLPPGTFVIVDQFIDRTTLRAGSFFGRGLVAPGAEVVEAYAQDLPALLAARGHARCDRVVSSLPFAGWPAEVQDAVFEGILGALAPDGRMVTFTYVHSPWLPAGRRARARLEEAFREVTTSPVVWRNLPPAFVYRCER